MTIPSGKTRRVVLCVYGAALLYFVMKQLYFTVCINGFPDQRAHYSYIIEMCRNPALIPDFASIPMYSITRWEGLTACMSLMEGHVNYLGHPALYYLLMSLTRPVRFLEDGTVTFDYLKVCLCNIALISAGAAIAFRVGYKRLRGRSAAFHLLFAAAIVTLPELGYVGASANNDNLAFFAFAVFFSGLIRYDEGKQDLKTYGLIGIGFLLGSFSKLTTALIMLIMLVVIFIMSVVNTKSLKLIANKYFLMTLPCYLLFLAYEIVIYRRWGNWQPGLAAVAPEYFRTTTFYVAPENRVSMTLPQYLRHFLGGIGYTWSSLYGHDNAVNQLMNNRHAGLIYWIPVAAAMIAAVIQAIKRKADRITIPAVLAFFGTMAYHFYTGWSGFVKNGYAGGTQARYYLALIIPFALIFACFLPEPKTKKAKAVTVVLAVILVALWVLGDAPRLLLTGIPSTA